MIIASRTHDFGKYPVRELAPMLKERGIDAAQLILLKGFQEINSYADITSDMILNIRESFEQSQVKIHILGCYMDLGNPDAEIRKKAVETFIRFLSYGKEIGAALVGTETAYPRLSEAERKLWYPYMEDSVQRIVEEAERVGQDMALEPVYWHPLKDLETTCAVFEKIDSGRLKMIFDPANVLEFPEIDQSVYWTQWLEALGDKVEALHIKDFVAEAEKGRRQVELGTGVMDYTVIADWMRKNKPDMVAVRESLPHHSAEKDIEYMKTVFRI